VTTKDQTSKATITKEAGKPQEEHRLGGASQFQFKPIVSSPRNLFSLPSLYVVLKLKES
jgi:hypothetical protein